MNAYDYAAAIYDDVVDFLKTEEIVIHESERDEMIEELNDLLWAEDSVTGNASGSYTFNAYQAEEYLCHNLDLLIEACDEFGQDISDAIKRGAEFCDVTIRCYLLGQVLNNVVNDVMVPDEDEDEDEDDE